MEEVFGFLLVFGIIVGGWVMGIVGFARAGRALREVAELRGMVTRLMAAGSAAGGADAQAAQTGEAGPAAEAQSASPFASPWARPAPVDGPPTATGRDDVGAPDALPSGSVQPDAPQPADGQPGAGTASGAEPSRPDMPPDDAGPAEAPPPPPPEEPRRSLEDLLTARWGVWAGAVALLMAGVFLIRYAVEQSLLGPGVRCILGFVSGAALIGAAEWLRRKPDMNEQVPPALVAGGVAVLFGAAYGAGVLYGLVPPLIGFVLLALVSFAAMVLSLRFGQLVAAIGVVGAYATPALVDSDDPSLPGLFIYLLFVIAAALAVVRYTAWVWLGWATTIAAAFWVLLGLAAGNPVDLWAPALFVPAAAALNLGLLPHQALDHPIGRRLAWVPCAALGLTGLLVALVSQGWDTRAGVLLMAPLMVWHAWREPRLRLMPYLAALLFLLLLAGWDVRVTDWPDITESPDRWVPQSVTGILATAAVVSGFFAAAGLFLWPRAAFPLPWASLTATVPVLTLAITYTRVTLFQTRFDWALAAFLLAGGLVATTAQAMRTSRAVAGTQAAGAAAAIALGCAMVLSDHWLTVAIALLLPALALIEAKTDLTPLRLVARAVATVVLVRLLLNWHVPFYAFGTTPVVNGLLAAYGVPAAAFALAAYLFRRRADDATVAVLQAGSAAFATVLVAAEIRHGFGQGDLGRTNFGFGEAALHVSALGVMALVTRRIAHRVGGTVLDWSWRIQGGVGVVGAILLLIHGNPLFSRDSVGEWPIANWLLFAYLLPAALAVHASRSMTGAQRPLARGLSAYALVALFVWVTLEIRHWFQGPVIGLHRDVGSAELWAWSGAWLVLGAILLVLGLRRDERPLRLAGIGVVMLTTVKVFIVDMSALEGLWRVLSFLGLGLALIGMGAVYQRLARSESKPAQQPQGPGPG